MVAKDERAAVPVRHSGAAESRRAARRAIWRRALLGMAFALAVAASLALIYQRPWAVDLNIGRAEGLDNDTPFLQGFYESQRIDNDVVRYRWTTRDAALDFPNLAGRPYLLQLRQINGVPVRLALGGRPAALTSDPGRVTRLFLPAPADGRLHLSIKADQPFAAPGDDRELGAAFQGGGLAALGGGVFAAAPPLWPLLAWSAAVAAVWLTVLALGGRLGEALAGSGLLAAGALAAAWFAPLRSGLAAGAIIQTTLYGLAFAALGRWIVPRMAAWSAGEERWAPGDPAMRWLILAATAVWALKLGGRLMPGSMPGDIGFHSNRIAGQMLGDLFTPSLHRGVSFPYPSALYALLAPLTATGVAPAWILQLAAAACEALALPIVYGLVAGSLGGQESAQGGSSGSRAGLFAAVLYGLCPAGFMTVAWSFDSHIFAQFLALAWSAALVRFWGRWHERRGWLAISGGLALIALSHFGFYINTSLLAGLLAVAIWLFLPDDRRQAKALAAAIVASQIVVWALYYSAFLDLFIKQGGAVAEGGMTAVNDRPALDRLGLLWDTLDIGFWRHYALLPVVLAPFGLARLWRRGRKPLIPAAALVIAATFAVSLALGALPIATGVPLTTRWLMFSAWAVAVCSGLALDALWRRARWGRWLSVAAALFVASWGLALWLSAVVYRIRPPEPF